MARVQVLKQVDYDFGEPDGWILLLQWCLYVYDEGTPEHGYRFIWRRPKADGGSLQAARGQARIPSLAVARALIAKAEKGGWGDYMSDDVVYYFTKYDIARGENVRSKRPATRGFIERVGGTMLEDTAQIVDLSQLDAEGRLIEG
jgi:hypothetical protein